MVSQQLITELQGIIREEYGQDLEMKEVSMLANDLVGYFNLMAKIYHKEKEPESRDLPDQPDVDIKNLL